MDTGTPGLESSWGLHLGTISLQIEPSASSLLQLLWSERESERLSAFLPFRCYCSQQLPVPGWLLIKGRGMVGLWVEEGLMRAGGAHTKHLMEHISHGLRPIHTFHIICLSPPSKPWDQQERWCPLRSDIHVLQRANSGTLTSALWLCGEASLNPFSLLPPQS